MRPVWLTIAALTVASAAAAQDSAPSPNAWRVDPAHSAVGFTVRHFFTPVHGTFGKYMIALNFDPAKPTEGSVDVTIEIASVNTNNERRDNDLRSDHFFEVEKFPTMTFKSASVREGSAPNQYVATGTLTIKDVSKEIALPFTFLGSQEVARGNRTMTVAGFEASLTIDRLAFGVGTGDWVRTNVVGGDVKVEIAIEARK